MKSTCKPFLVIMLVIATTLHAFSMAQAGFRRGGAKDTFFDIIACKDGVSVDVGINAQLSIPPLASIKAARLVSGNIVIFDGKPITWILDRGPGVVIDTKFGETVTQTFTGSKVIKWNDGIQLRPGNRILLEGVEIMGREVDRFVPDTAGTFEAIIGNCETTDPPNDNISRVFKFDRYEDDETMIPANSVAIESVITVTPETSSFPPGQVIVDINVGMYLEAHVSEVFLISPSGSKARLFQNLDSDSFGTRLSHLGDHGLTSDLMPDFILDDDSEFDFGKSSSPYNTNAIHPDQPLSIFNGEDPHGNWTLEIDNTSQFIGSLKGWDIEIEVANSINKTVSIEQTCTVLEGLNLRWGPGTDYAPPIKILPKNSEVQMVARNTDSKWLQVKVIPDGTNGWVYAQFVNCTVPVSSLPLGVIPPTEVSIGSGSGNNLDGELMTASSMVSDPTGNVVFRDNFYLRMRVHDPNQGHKDGDGIDHVNFTILDESGKKVYERRENTASYCSFMGGEPDCQILALKSGEKWPNSELPITNGFYTAIVNVFRLGNNNSSGSWSVNFKIDSPQLGN